MIHVPCLLAWLALQPAGAADPKPATSADVDAFMEDAARFQEGVEAFRAEVRGLRDAKLGVDNRKADDDAARVKARKEQEKAIATRKAMAALERYLCTYAPEVVDGVTSCTVPPAPASVRSKDVVLQSLRLGRLYYEEIDAAYKAGITIGKRELANFERPLRLYGNLIAAHGGAPGIEAAMAAKANMLSWHAAVTFDLKADPDDPVNSPVDMVQLDVAQALQLYTEIVEKYPSSPVAWEAHFWLGEHFQRREVEPDGVTPSTAAQVAGYYDEAIKHYGAIVAKGPTTYQYQRSLVQLGRVYYLAGRFEESLRYLEQVAETGKEGADKVASLLPSVYGGMQGKSYRASWYRDTNDNGAVELGEVAFGHLTSLGDRPWVQGAMASLALSFWMNSAFDEARATYRLLQERWPNHPDNPLFQYNLYQMLSGEREAFVPQVGRAPGKVVVPQDPSASGSRAQEQLQALSKQYGPRSSWYAANAPNAAARGRAMELIGRESKRIVETELYAAAGAYNAHVQAKTPATEAAMRAAASQFVDVASDLMAEFPALRSDNLEFAVARALYWANRSDEALAALDRIAAAASTTCVVNEQDPRSPLCAEQARQLAWTARRERLVAEHGGSVGASPGYLISADESRLPRRIGDAVRESIVTTPGGAQIERFALPDAHADYMKATDGYLAFPFTHPSTQVSPESRLGLAYQLGQLEFAYGRYPEARARFMALIDAAPASEIAQNAATLVITTLREEQDRAAEVAAAADFSARFRSVAAAKANDMADVERKGRFFLLQARETGKDGVALGADAMKALAKDYIAYADTYASSAEAEVALQKAISLLDQAREIDESLKLTRRYVASYPNSQSTLVAYWRLAAQSTRAMNVEDAIQWYTTFVDQSRKRANDPAWAATLANIARPADLREAADIPHAAYYIANLSAGLDDPTAAARAWETYAVQHAPPTYDAATGLVGQEAAFWKARDYWRVAGEGELRKFYERYTRANFDASDVSHQILAWDALATSAETAGKKRDAEAARERVKSLYEPALAQGVPLDIEAHEVGAKAAMEALAAGWKQYGVPNPWPTDKKALLSKVVAVLDGGEVGPVVQLAAPMTSMHFEAQQMAAYHIGLAWARDAALLDISNLDGSPMDLAVAFPVALLGADFEVGTDGFDLWSRLLVDEDPEAFASLPRLNRSPERVVGATEARAKAADMLERAVASARDLGQWSAWTDKSMELLATEIDPKKYSTERVAFCEGVACGETAVRPAADMSSLPAVTTTAGEGSK